MSYLFDSNLCIAILNGKTGNIEGNLNRAILGGSSFHVSSIVVHELWYGVAKSQLVLSNTQKLNAFLKKYVSILSFDEEDAKAAAAIRAELSRKGTPIGPYDVLIAGQALVRGLTLVTANTREFSRVTGLKLVDWS